MRSRATEECSRAVLGASRAMSSLEAIRYARGNLELLDQLALPLETKYIDVRDCDACWRCIKDMNVRGGGGVRARAV